MYDNTIYVSDIKEAFDKYEERFGYTNKKGRKSKGIDSVSPAIIAIVRRSCEPVPGNTPRMNFIRGRINSKDNKNNIITSTAVIDMKMTYDISVIGYDQYTVDTLVDELYMMLYSGNCGFTYPSGSKNPNNPSEEEMVKSYLKIDDGGVYGEISEAVDVPNAGRVYRTTFSVFTYGGLFMTNESKRVLRVPINIDHDK